MNIKNIFFAFTQYIYRISAISLIIIIFVLLFSVYTKALSSSGCLMAYNFTANSTDDICGSNDMTLYNGLTYSGNLGLSFDGTDDFSATTNTSVCGNWINSNWTICSEYITGNLQYETLISCEPTPLPNRDFVIYGVQNNQYAYVTGWEGSTSHDTYNIGIFTLNTPYFVCVQYDKPNQKMRIFKNNTEITYYEQATTPNINTASGNLTLGTHGYYYTENFNGKLKRVYVFNYLLTTNEMKDLQANGTTGTAPPGTPSLIINTNLIKTINYKYTNVTISFNGTFSSANTDLVNCTIYDNSTIINLTQERNLSINQNFVYSVLDSQRDYLFKINCSNYELSATTIFFNYSIDNVNPIIQTSYTDYKNVSQLDTNIIYSNFSDANLFAYQILILDIVGNIELNKTAINLTETFYSNVTSRLETVLGNYTINFTAWDSHTSKNIKDYDIKNITKGKKIEDSISFISDIFDISFNKDIDRYKIKLKFKNKLTSGNLTIKTDEKFFYLPNSKHTLHIVDFKNKKWIDFNSYKKFNYTITFVSENEILINFYDLTGNEIEFNSIGDLNVYSIIRHFQVKSVSTGGGLTESESGWLLDIRNYSILLYGVFQMINESILMFFTLLVSFILIYIISIYSKKYSDFFFFLYPLQILSILSCLMYFLDTTILNIDNNTLKIIILLCDFFTFIFLFLLYVVFFIKSKLSEVENKKEKNKYYDSF